MDSSHSNMDRRSNQRITNMIFHDITCENDYLNFTIDLHELPLEELELIIAILQGYKIRTYGIQKKRALKKTQKK